MDFTPLMPWGIFFGIASLVWFLSSLFSAKPSRVSARLDELRNPALRQKSRPSETQPQKRVSSLLEKAAPTLSKALEPKSELEQSKLKLRLANAGFNSPTAPTIFLATKVAGLVVGITIGTAYGLMSFGLTQNGLTSMVVAGGIGFYLPEIILTLKISSRKEKIFLALPDALDLLVVCVESGLGLDAGMRRVTDELSDASPEVCGEFAMCNMQLQMGRARRDVLRDLGLRTGVDDMRALSAILIQAEKFGSSIAQALRVQSDTMRVKRRQLAEERAQQTAVKMIFPLVLFIFPGIFVILVGPAAIQLINGMLSK